MVAVNKRIKDSRCEEWQKQFKNRITSVSGLERELSITEKEKREINSVTQLFKMSITPFYLNMIDRSNPNCPIRKQAIPSAEELYFKPEELDDPLGDNRHSPVARLTHRYPDRVLVFPTYECAAYCRHCFRRRIVGSIDKSITEKEINDIVNYIQNHKEIKEVIFTGGDPLMLADSKLKKMFSKVRTVSHVRILRIHTRVMVTLPQRITPKLTSLLRSIKPLYLIVHINHVKEISSEFKRAVRCVADAGIPIFSQSVLLRGINDDVQSLKDLFYGLVEVGVKPYYLHHCDLARGISHFRTGVKEGVDLLKQLRGYISGICIPYYMVETTGGHGKVPVVYNYIRREQSTMIEIENYDGCIYKHPS